ncbi:response regulator receiver modulated chemotaxis protein CheW [Candidatus Magnetomorum sp. HK-1]|nr:response regulator receiver modulated chemotaxis protein CheW [Candidatus Magnetomorum sp. HK-1]
MAVDYQTKILLVEDFTSMRKLECNALSSLSFENIVEAKNGEEALALLKQEKDIGLIICDQDLPGKDGYDVLTSVRKQEQFAQIPFLMLANRGEKRNIEKAYNAGANSFIAKPFAPKELKYKIEQALGEQPKASMTVKRKAVKRESASGKTILRVAHLPITDHIILGVVQHFLQKGKYIADHFELEVIRMATWNAVSYALESGEVDAAFVLAPIAMDLFSVGIPIKLVLFAHKNGSIFVRNRQGDKYQEPFQDFFKEKAFLIPHTMSVHHMIAHMFFSNIGLTPGAMGHENPNLHFEVSPLPKMHDFIKASPESCGFFVAEPLGTKAIASSLADLILLSSEIWENHPCCVVAMQDDFIQQFPDAVFEFTNFMVKAGQFVGERPGIAAEIGVEFLDPNREQGLKVPLLKNVLSEPLGIKTTDLYPSIHDLEKIQHYMHDKMGVGQIIDLKSFVDLTFADKVCSATPDAYSSILHDRPDVSLEILNRQADEDQNLTSKSVLNMVGKYLTLSLGNQQFGIDISKVREIIGILPTRPVPQTPDYVMGVINLRGLVIPVIELRLKLGMAKGEYNDRSCIIVLDVNMLGGSKRIGVAVDTVAEVQDVRAEDIEEPPSAGLGIDSKNLLGMAKLNNEVKMLLDIDQVLCD